MAFPELAEIASTTALLLLVWTLYSALWRLFLSPIACVPGPKLAVLTWWYEFYYDAVLPGKYIFKIQELHKQYGPMIRVTPSELHINDANFLDTIYAPSSVHRDKYEYQLRTLRVPTAVGTTANYHLHKRRREALSPVFAKKNVLSLEPLIMSKVDQLCDLLGEFASRNSPANLLDAFFAFTTDVVTNFLFAHQSNVLADPAKAAVLRRNSNQLLLGIKVNQHFPWIPDIFESLPLSWSKPMMPPGLIDMMELSGRVRSELIDIMNDRSAKEEGLRDDEKRSVFYTLLESPALPPAEKTMLRLEQEGTLLVLAGSESPARTLTAIFYHLLSNPFILEKLRAELKSVPPTASWSQLEQLACLSAVIEEGNRLSWGVTARLARIASEPLQYGTYTIPAGTPVSITTLSVHTDESIFPNPYTFIPDRWLGPEGTARRKYQMAFNKGGRRCLGIELARAELYLTTAALVRRFDMALYETGADDVAFLHDYQVAMGKLGSLGVRVLPQIRKSA